MIVCFVNGLDLRRGWVEVLYLGSWGIVCDNVWDMCDVNVVCCMLGFLGVLVVYGGVKYGFGKGCVWFGDVRCKGDEMNIVFCFYKDYSDCSYLNDVGVVCWVVLFVL